jgi:hypothetical protein
MAGAVAMKKSKNPQSHRLWAVFSIESKLDIAPHLTGKHLN